MATTGISPKRKAPAPSAGPQDHGVTLSPSLCHTRVPPVTSYSHFFLLNITSSTTMMTMHTTMMAW